MSARVPVTGSDSQRIRRAQKTPSGKRLLLTHHALHDTVPTRATNCCVKSPVGGIELHLIHGLFGHTRTGHCKGAEEREGCKGREGVCAFEAMARAVRGWGSSAAAVASIAVGGCSGTVAWARISY